MDKRMIQKYDEVSEIYQNRNTSDNIEKNIEKYFGFLDATNTIKSIKNENGIKYN